MKAAVLNQLLADREAKRPVILATNLETALFTLKTGALRSSRAT